MTCLDILHTNGHDTMASSMQKLFEKEFFKPSIFIKNEQEKKRDIMCFRHLSYSCPCAVQKKRIVAKNLKK